MRRGPLPILQKGEVSMGQNAGIQFALGKFRARASGSDFQGDGCLAGLLGRASCRLHSWLLSWRRAGWGVEAVDLITGPFHGAQQGSFRAGLGCTNTHIWAAGWSGQRNSPTAGWLLLTFCTKGALAVWGLPGTWGSGGYSLYSAPSGSSPLWLPPHGFHQDWNSASDSTSC
jgi:hypothetical protein